MKCSNIRKAISCRYLNNTFWATSKIDAEKLRIF